MDLKAIRKDNDDTREHLSYALRYKPNTQEFLIPRAATDADK